MVRRRTFASGGEAGPPGAGDFERGERACGRGGSTGESSKRRASTCVDAVRIVPSRAGLSASLATVRVWAKRNLCALPPESSSRVGSLLRASAAINPGGDDGRRRSDREPRIDLDTRRRRRLRSGVVAAERHLQRVAEHFDGMAHSGALSRLVRCPRKRGGSTFHAGSRCATRSVRLYGQSH